MATYVNNLRLKEIATGDESGTWGTSTNTNLELIGEALGYNTQDCFASDADATTTVADGATDPARAFYFKVTSSATLTATRTLTIAPNTVSRVMIIENATTGSQSIAISQGSGANVTVPTGEVKMVYLDGAGSGAVVTDGFANLKVTDAAQTNITSVGTLTSLTVSGDATFDTSTLYVDSTNNRVGIGTTSPDRLLTLQGDNSYMWIKDAGGGNVGFIGGSGENDGLFRLYEGGGHTAKVEIHSDAVSYFNGGNVGIGLTSPSDTLEIQSSGNDDGFRLKGSGGDDLVWLHQQATDSVIMRMYDGGTVKVLLDASGGNSYFTGGKVIIGDSASHTTDLLQIETPASGGGHGIQIRRNDANTDQVVGHVMFGNNTDTDLVKISAKTDGDSNAGDSGALLFSTQPTGGSVTERMRIDSSGNVAIGTTTADSMLHLYKATGSGALEPEIKIENNHNTSSETDGAGRLTFYSDDSNNAGIPDNAWLGQVRFMGDDKDGSATEFEYAYMVGRARDPGSGTARKGGVSFFTRDGNSLTETLTITEDKAGIGDSAPSYTLDVNTSGNASAFRISNGTNGQDLNCTISNGGTTAGDDSLFDITTQAGAGDPKVRFTIAGNENYEIGIDNTDGDKLKISQGSALGTDDRITVSGANVGIGTSSPSTRLYVYNSGGGSSDCMTVQSGSTANSNVGMILFRDNDQDYCGQITTNASTNTTIYNTNTSDERLKENITDWEVDALSLFKNIEPKEFNFKSQDEGASKVRGYIAQTEASKFPEAFTTDTSEEAYYSYNPSGMVIYLMKALKEQVAINEALEARITALES